MQMVLSSYMLSLFCVSALGSTFGSDTAGVAMGTVSFEQYAQRFARRYGQDEYELRKSLFEERMEWILLHNSNPKKLWTAGLNHLTDRTQEELARMRGRSNSGNSRKTASLLTVPEVNTNDLLQSVDWTNLTAQKLSKDQGECGSCWAVAAASLLEAHYEIHSGTHRTMSAQDFVNCVPNPSECGGQGGCEGATVELAVEYALKHGLATLEDVPYRATDGTCRHESLLQRSAGAIEKHGFDGLEDGSSLGLTSWSTLPMNKAEPLMRALASGPVAVSVGADHWFRYQEGVFDSCSKDTIINHAVLMVGYGRDEQKTVNYWRIQNSWGDSFGEDGYIRLFRHDTVVEDDAHCGIDNKPGDGIECKPYPDTVPVCGMCGIMYDSVAPVFSKVSSKAKKAPLQQALRGLMHKV